MNVSCCNHLEIKVAFSHDLLSEKLKSNNQAVFYVVAKYVKCQSNVWSNKYIGVFHIS